jgi:hypothetical protein
LGKSRAPEVDEEGLTARRSGHGLKLFGLHKQFAEYEAKIRVGELPSSYVAIDAIASLLCARIEGCSDAELRACWPSSWGNSEVTLPTALIYHISQAWIEYGKDSAGKTSGAVLGLEGGGKGRKGAVAAQRKRKQHNEYGRQVALLYTGLSAASNRPTLDKAIEEISEMHNVSFETVESAYKKYGRPLIEDALRLGILKGVKTF